MNSYYPEFDVIWVLKYMEACLLYFMIHLCFKGLNQNGTCAITQSRAYFPQFNFYFLSLVVGLKSCGLYGRFVLGSSWGNWRSLRHSAVIGTNLWGEIAGYYHQFGWNCTLCRFKFIFKHKIFMSPSRHIWSSPQMSMSSGPLLEARQGVPHNDYIVNPPHNQPAVVLRLLWCWRSFSGYRRSYYSFQHFWLSPLYLSAIGDAASVCYG